MNDLQFDFLLLYLGYQRAFYISPTFCRQVSGGKSKINHQV